jgi:agmatine/peptidylarginine deiminase
MFNDQNTNTLALSARLEDRYPNVYDTLVSACGSNSVSTFALMASENIWCRDWMPIQVGDLFIKFRYGYGVDNPRFKSLATSKRDWGWLHPLTNSTLRLDGGNVVRNGDKIVMTDIIYRHNSDVPKTRLISQLEELLQGEITIIPAEPGDDIGHADGICHFTPYGRLLVANHYGRGKRETAYANRLSKSLKNFATVQFPHAYHRCPVITHGEFRKQFPHADTFNPGFGYYINFLTVQQLLFIPIFGIEEDADAVLTAKECFPDYKVFAINCDRLSMEGGLINCVTMNYEF